MLALLLVAVSLGLGNFAAAVSLGTGGVDARIRLRVGLVFGAFEAGMPVVGLLIGDHVAGQLGEATRWIGGALLVTVGLYSVVGDRDSSGDSTSRDGPGGDSTHGDTTDAVSAGHAVSPDRADRAADSDRTVGLGCASSDRASPEGAASGVRGDRGLRLLLSGLALSLDNLVAGFALGTAQVGILAGAVIIGVVSALLSLAGLELGAWLGGRIGQRSAQLGGIILVAVGVAIAVGLLA